MNFEQISCSRIAEVVRAKLQLVKIPNCINVNIPHIVCKECPSFKYCIQGKCALDIAADTSRHLLSDVHNSEAVQDGEDEDEEMEDAKFEEEEEEEEQEAPIKEDLMDDLFQEVWTRFRSPGFDEAMRSERLENSIVITVSHQLVTRLEYPLPWI